MPKEFGAWFKDQAVKPEQTLQVDLVVPCGEGTLPAAPYSVVEPDVKTTHVEIVINCKDVQAAASEAYIAAARQPFARRIAEFPLRPAQKISDLPAKISGDLTVAPQPQALHGMNVPLTLLDALGLPKNVKECSIHFEAGAIAKVAGYTWNMQTHTLDFFSYELTISQLEGFTNAVQDHGIARRAP